MYTEKDIEEYIAENREHLTKSLSEHEDIPSSIKPSFQIVWDAGCWLNNVLRENGASDQEREAIGFAHGQRSFGGNSVKEAVRLANEFVTTGTTKDRPGLDLAVEICNEMLEKSDQKWGMYDTKDNCWFGDSDGPKLFGDEELAQVACRVVDVQLKQPAGRTRARLFQEKDLQKKDERQILRSGEEAINRLENGLEL